jgi:hypothetical protein
MQPAPRRLAVAELNCRISGVLMIANISIVKCPVCDAEGDFLHHDVRSSLLYSCENCRHEWQEAAEPEYPPDLKSGEQPPVPVTRNGPRER